jgi:hypothetical protein
MNNIVTDEYLNKIAAKWLTADLAPVGRVLKGVALGIPAAIGLSTLDPNTRDSYKYFLLDRPGEALSKKKDEIVTQTLPKVRDEARKVIKEEIPQVVNTAIDATKDYFQSPNNPVAASPNGSIWNTINPFSGLTGGVDYVPQKWLDLFPNNPQLAHMTFKTGAIGLLAAGLIGGYRMATNTNSVEDPDDRPGADMSKQLSTTFSGGLGTEDNEYKKKQKKAASLNKQADPTTEVQAPNNFSWGNTIRTALPVGACILAASLAYKGFDKAMDASRNAQLDDAIASKEDVVKRLIQTRARVAKGLATDDEVYDAMNRAGKSGYTKAANLDKEALLGESVQTAGLISAAIVLASAIGAYNYTSAADPNNIKFKAYKKALKEYAKTKSGMTPITITPTDAQDYFAGIDEGSPDTVDVRKQPDMDYNSLNRPISISF